LARGGWLAALVAAGLALASPALRAEEPPRFEIRRFVFEGATLVTQERLQAATAPFTGPGRDFGDVQRALEAVERAYNEAGYSAVQVLLPEQELARGEVRLRIVEARVGRVIVEGNRYFDDANIRASVPSLVPGAPPNITGVGRNLRVANENPSKQSTVLLRSGSEEATVDAVVRVIDEPPAKYSVSVDSTGTRETGWLRVGLGFLYANGANRDQVLTLQAVGAPYKSDDPNQLSLVPSDRVLILGMGLRVPLYELGDAIDVIGGYSNVDSGTVGGLFNVSGAGGVFALRYTHYLDRQGEYDHRLALGWDIHGYHNSGVQAVGSTQQLTPDITVRPLSLTYSGLLRRPHSETAFSIGAWRNIPGGSDGQPADFCQLPPNDPYGVSRSDGMGHCPDPYYLLWRGTFNHNQALSGDWQFHFGFSGQATRDMLVSGEQFGIGGQDSVRGFDERALIDDRGFQGTLEIYTPDFGARAGWGDTRVRALAFYDWGTVRRVQPAPGDPTRQGIASVGVGLRVNRGNRLAFRLDWGLVVDGGGAPGPNGDPGTYKARGDSRFHGSLSLVF
jgi:hemolysin activation/secretion protein